MRNSKEIILGLLLLTACSGERETPKGYKFTVVSRGDGAVVKPGRFLKVDLYFKDGKDSIWYDNRNDEMGQIIPVTDTSNIRFEEGILEVFRMVSKGDSVVMNVPVGVLFEKTWNQPVPPGVDPRGNFTFCLRVKDVLDTAQIEKLQAELAAKANEKAIQQQAEQLGKDTVIIDNYLKERNLEARRTSSGLRYIVARDGRGGQVTVGQTVDVDYSGYLLNGKYFDTSNRDVATKQGILRAEGTYKPYTLVVGTGSVIQGWDEILLLMRKGSRVTVFIPSGLAYGNTRRSEDIVENTILIFDMELVDVR